MVPVRNPGKKLKTVLHSDAPKPGSHCPNPILGFLRLLRFLGQLGSHSSEESPTAHGIYL